MNILGIETSCDETAVAIYSEQRGLCAHHVYSQAIHSQYGGVVPELASRDHIRKTLPLVEQALKQAEMTPEDITGIAYTKGPGLIGALMVGACVGHSLAFGWGIPAIGIHHIEAHLMVSLMEHPDLQYPFLALVVSGGHTLLLRVEGLGQYHLLGQSLDDAVGEAFDKTAKLLGLGYPGGAALAKLAEQGRAGIHEFPRPMVNRPGLEFSFSGIKTHAVNCLQRSDGSEQDKADIARAFEEAIVDTLAIKCKRALEQEHLRDLVVVGGVSANKKLRAHLHHLEKKLQVKVRFVSPEFCTDNGAMVAYTGYLHFKAGREGDLAIDVKARMAL